MFINPSNIPFAQTSILPIFQRAKQSNSKGFCFFPPCWLHLVPVTLLCRLVIASTKSTLSPPNGLYFQVSLFCILSSLSENQVKRSSIFHSGMWIILSWRHGRIKNGKNISLNIHSLPKSRALQKNSVDIPLFGSLVTREDWLLSPEMIS